MTWDAVWHHHSTSHVIPWDFHETSMGLPWEPIGCHGDKHKPHGHGRYWYLMHTVNYTWNEVSHGILSLPMNSHDPMGSHGTAMGTHTAGCHGMRWFSYGTSTRLTIMLLMDTCGIHCGYDAWRKLRMKRDIPWALPWMPAGTHGILCGPIESHRSNDSS